MEGISSRMYNGLKGYWRRRRLASSVYNYKRLNGSNTKNLVVVKFGGAAGSNRRKRLWRRVKVKAPKIKLRCFSPKKLFIGIRDAYVNMMLRVANSRTVGVSGGYGNGLVWTRPNSIKEYDEKILVELCKKILMAQNQIVS